MSGNSGNPGKDWSTLFTGATVGLQQNEVSVVEPGCHSGGRDPLCPFNRQNMYHHMSPEEGPT